MMNSKPWVTGPVELLNFAMEQLHAGSDVARRVAMIQTDNAVEIMLKTHVALPKSDGGLGLSPKEQDEACRTFPALMQTVTTRAPAALDGIDAGTIPYYHKIRNHLYHEWNGTTVERAMIEGYLSVARRLLRNLFAVEISEPQPQAVATSAADFEQAWQELEAKLDALNNKVRFRERPLRPIHWIEEAVGRQILIHPFEEDYDELFRFHGRIAGGDEKATTSELLENIFLARRLIKDVERARKSP